MNINSKYRNFVEAFNNFDSRPLSGENLEKFYIEDFSRHTVNEIITTIRITERFRKLLIIGHRGCGKSTILNKISKELNKEFHVVSFSAADVVNMVDLETVDILLATYLQVLASFSRSEKPDSKTKILFEKFNDFVNVFKDDMNIDEAGINLLSILSFKFKVEPESRATIRNKLNDQIKLLQTKLSEACTIIKNYKHKDVLIIIDDLDKLNTKIAERIFYENFFMLTLPEVKIVYTFPLDTYYSEYYISISDRYDVQFIPLVNLSSYDGGLLEISYHSLKKLILQRIRENLIDEDAIHYLIEMSGGLLRDLVKFMQNSCKHAIVDNSPVINKTIAESAVIEYINDYYRVFDFSKYCEKVYCIMENKNKIDNESLVHLLRYLFVLEYRHEKNIWYDAHPCMKNALKMNMDLK